MSLAKEPIELLRRLEACTDPDVELLVLEFKDALRALHKLNTCSHYSGGRSHKVCLSDGTVVTCNCKEKASTIFTRWALILQDI